jgi:ABC-type sugar transport system ATPase subunit
LSLLATSASASCVGCLMFKSRIVSRMAFSAEGLTAGVNPQNVRPFCGFLTHRGLSSYPKLPERPAVSPMMEVQALAGARVNGISFALRRGEILGVGGLAGHGHRELLFMLFGAERVGDGSITVDGRRVSIRTPRDAVRRRIGIALVPEDRKTEGLMLAMSVRDNLTLAILHRIARFGVLRQWAERRSAEEMAARLKIRIKPWQSGRLAEWRQPAKGTCWPMAARRAEGSVAL